jgi:hypothetical protein
MDVFFILDPVYFNQDQTTYFDYILPKKFISKVFRGNPNLHRNLNRFRTNSGKCHVHASKKKDQLYERVKISNIRPYTVNFSLKEHAFIIAETGIRVCASTMSQNFVRI